MSIYSSLEHIRKQLDAGELSCVQLVEHYLHNIQAGKELNVFLEVYEEEALVKAKEIDLKLKEGTAGRLAGMVIGVKDVLSLEGHKLSASSKMLENYEAQYTGTAIQKIIDEDSIIIGRQNCDEFAMGSSNESSYFGSVKNAANTEYVPGGSSGGSAVAVQADMCLVSLGTDTGGSVRQPASYCGVVGMKPTYSRISRYGLIAFASSFDTIGIFSKSISDNALVLEVIAGEDKLDSTSSRHPVDNYSGYTEKKNKKLKIACISEAQESDGLVKEVKEILDQNISKLESEGHSVENVAFPLLKYLLPTYYILTMAEASSNLSRYDGVRYGYRSENTSDLNSLYTKTRVEGFGDEVIRRIMMGTFVLSASYYDAYYNKAQKVRRLIREQTKSILKEYDFILLPTTPSPAFKIGQERESAVEVYLEDLFTVQASVAGIPAISIPKGTSKDGLPIGLQIMADDFDEKALYSFSDYLMKLN